MMVTFGPDGSARNPSSPGVEFLGRLLSCRSPDELEDKLS
jgi:hypothetical protein